MSRAIVSIVMMISFVAPAAAGPAPEAMNFQGVLRDASGAPLDGSYDMTFRLYEFASAGTVLYTDAHLASGFGAVSVSEGLFTVAIGTGDHGNQVLSDVFRDHIDVWVEIEIGGEILSPRIQVFAAGHALNATNAESAGDAGLLDALDSSQFLRSDQDDSTTGVLRASRLETDGDLVLNANDGLEDPVLHFLHGGVVDGTLTYDGSFGLSRPVETSYGMDILSGGNVYLGWTGGIGDEVRKVYFYDDGSSTGEFFGWTLSRFELSDELEMYGDLRTDAVYVNWRDQDPSGDGYLYFREDNVWDGEAFYWNNAEDAFFVTDGFVATGELHTEAPQIVINRDGPNGNQDIEFYNNGSQTERFQWDNGNQQFEVSDDFFAHGDIDAVGAKNFVQNHPYRDDLEIVYTALEGNEAVTFTRGTARLRGGQARIELEESFGYVTNSELGLTVHLTPRGGHAVLFTDSVSTRELVVRSEDSADAAFDYIVYGLRLGYEDRPVFRPKRSEAFLPLPDELDEELSAEPGRDRTTAAQRHRQMHLRAFGTPVVESEGDEALRQAIGMREPDLDFPRGSEIPEREMNRIALEKERGVADVVREEAVAPIADPAVGDASTPSGETAPQTATATLRRDDQGNVYARSFRPSAGDIASVVRVGEPVEAGDVLVIDPHGEGGMVLARNQGDTTVFGVVAAEPGVVLGARDAGSPADGAEQPLEAAVAVSGVVLCKVDASWGSIRPGDLLMTSPTPGHAMRADEPRIGNVLGKALEPLEVGTGLIRVLVTLR